MRVVLPDPGKPVRRKIFPAMKPQPLRWMVNLKDLTAMDALDFPLTLAREGSVEFYIPKVEGLKRRGPGTAKIPVFYNPAMELNRDLAVLFLKAVNLIRQVKSACEPMAGCGVRGIRFAVEVEGIEKVVMNDLNPRAVRLAKLNVEKAGVQGKVQVFNFDAEELLCRYSAPGERFDYVDLDPYGSPIPYLDSALRAVRLGGFLALTATDMPLLCGAAPKPCLRRYGAKPLRTEYCHELAARILIGSAVRLAARRDLALKPVFTHASDHYVRVYFQLLKGGSRADEVLSWLGLVYHCSKCLNRTLVKGLKPPQPALKCECGKPLEPAGPLWLGGLWSLKLVEAMLNQLPKASLGQFKAASRLLERVREEAQVESPTYYTVDRLAEKYGGLPPSPAEVVKVLRAEGFKASLTHFNPQSFRTSAPHRVVVEAFRRLSQN